MIVLIGLRSLEDVWEVWSNAWKPYSFVRYKSLKSLFSRWNRPFSNVLLTQSTEFSRKANMIAFL